MLVDLIHNKIIRETITEAFERGISERVIPALEDKYGEALCGVQMYEDYLSDGFLVDGVQYYPLTVVLDEGRATEWICWDVDKSLFKDGVPFSYVGDGIPALRFSEDSALTDGFESRMKGRAIYCEPGIINIRVEAAALAPTFLSGKYSQTFIDEMSRQLTPAIEAAMSVAGLADSGLELSLIFAPDTYMEHTSENVTYRRLVLSDKTSMPRDLWIKWTRLDGATAYSVADHVSAENILFELGEDVPQKIREKEYRFLLRVGKDKYHNAMGRRNITEWREMIKRAVRRGELIKVESTVILSEQATDLSAEFARVLGMDGVSPSPVAAEPTADFDDDAVRLARELLGIGTSHDEAAEEMEIEESVDEADELDTAEEYEDEEESEDDAENDEYIEEREDGLIVDFEEVEGVSEVENEEVSDDVVLEPFEEAVEEQEIDPIAEIYDEDDESTLAELHALDPDEEEQDELLPEDEPAEETLDPIAEIFDDDLMPTPAAEIVEAEETVDPAVSAAELEARIRAEVEAKVRLEYEREARIRAEQEMERLRRAQEELRAENERLIAEAERRRAEIAAEREARARREAVEQERMAEAAKLAVEEQRRIEAERAREEQIRAAEAERLEAERLRAEEERRLEAEREAERERILRESEKRDDEDGEPTAESAPVVEATTETEPVCISKTVRLIFRRHVDPNVTGRMQEIIKATVEYYGKENVPLRIRATVPDDMTVRLEFLRIPENEMELLSNIIKVLGNSGLGIAKAVVD